jgi:hypothetical protein
MGEFATTPASMLGRCGRLSENRDSSRGPQPDDAIGSGLLLRFG